MSKHTPGPWRTLPEEADRDYVRVRGGQLGARYKIANVPSPVYPGVSARELEETRANARLIAAAPELLSFVERYIEHFEAHDITNTNGCNVDATGFLEGLARTAIAKATGEAA